MRLKSENGIWMESDDELNSYMHFYFSELFTSVGTRNLQEALAVVHPVITVGTRNLHEALAMMHPVITADMNWLLIRGVPKDEIKTAAFQLGLLRSQGPDGYPRLFYQKYWSDIGADVCNAVKSFFEGEFLLKEMNQTNLVLQRGFCSSSQLNFVNLTSR